MYVHTIKSLNEYEDLEFVYANGFHNSREVKKNKVRRVHGTTVRFCVYVMSPALPLSHT